MEPMQTDPHHAAAFDFSGQVIRLYAALISGAPAAPQQTEPSLGGKLLYAAELEPKGHALVIAANIAGAATLAATSDPAAQKQAIRDGVIDFLVTSLDEALRILKNEIRKHETVAVCVAAAPEAVKREMLERGVLPDLIPQRATPSLACEEFLAHGARRLETDSFEELASLVAWQVSAAPAQWLPKLDAIALDCLDPEDWRARRWLRLAPRYLGRLAQGMHVACFTPQAKQAFISRVEEGMHSGEIGIEVNIQTAD